MKALLVRVESQAEIKFIAELLKKLGVSATLMSEDDIEDYGMAALMKDADRNKQVSRETVMKKLKAK